MCVCACVWLWVSAVGVTRVTNLKSCLTNTTHFTSCVEVKWYLKINKEGLWVSSSSDKVVDGSVPVYLLLWQVGIPVLSVV